MSDEQNIRAIACNVATAAPAYSRGALAYVMQFAGNRARVLVRSRGSRWVSVWLGLSELGNFRFKSLPVANPLFHRVMDFSPEYFDDENLEHVAARGAGHGLELRGD